jgi:hypothetical protein
MDGPRNIFGDFKTPESERTDPVCRKLARA